MIAASSTSCSSLFRTRNNRSLSMRISQRPTGRPIRNSPARGASCMPASSSSQSLLPSSEAHVKRIAYVLVLFFALPKVMLAEEHCLPSETIRQCYHHFVPILPKEAQADAEAASAKVANATQKTVAAANTGISSLVSPSQSASKDFLSLLSAALEAAAQGNDAKPVTLAYNIPIRRLLDAEQ